ncbi:MAG: HdeD family acid-resistance protein [Verrucomicrobiota bacterium]
MSSPTNPFAQIDPETLKKNAGFAQVAGIVMIVLGGLAVLLPGAFSLGLELFLGWLFLIGGILQAISAFQHIQAKGFIWALLNGVFAAIAGGLMIAQPVIGVLTLTILLAGFYLVDGVCKLIAVAQGKQIPGRGIILLNGIFGLIIAGIVISQWPISAQWFIGIIVGVNLLMGGITMISLATAVKKGGFDQDAQ